MIFITAKAFFRTGQYIRCFELLQQQFIEQPSYTSLLFIYGKYVVKTVASAIRTVRQSKGRATGNEKVDSGYLGSGIGALEECTRTCFKERTPQV